jgi:bacillithiol system protein YtxJ
MRFEPAGQLPFSQPSLFLSGMIFVELYCKQDIMNWIELKSEDQLNEILEQSKIKPQVIFKHSARCSISAMAKGRLERSAPPENADFYFLDLIAHRNISNKISSKFNVFHESPQVLLIRNGECVYDESHASISMDEIKEQVAV